MTPEDEKGDVYDIVWNLESVKPLNPEPLPEATMYRELDVGSQMIENIPVNGELGSGGAIQYEFYFWDTPMYYPHRYVEATTPILHTKGDCCMDNNTHMITIDEEGQVLDLVINNRNNLVHSMHLHGKGFYVIGNGYNQDGNVGFEEANGDYDQAPCDDARFSDPSVKSADRWGCPFDAERDADKLNFEDPPMMDTVGIPPYSWVYLRYVADTPGAWSFHCHTYDHTLRGMKMVLNVLPDLVPEIPDHVIRCGPCDTYETEQAECDAAFVYDCAEECGFDLNADASACEADLADCETLNICDDETTDWACDCDELFEYCSITAEARHKSCEAKCLSSESGASAATTSASTTTTSSTATTSDSSSTTTVSSDSYIEAAEHGAREDDPDDDDRAW